MVDFGTISKMEEGKHPLFNIASTLGKAHQKVFITRTQSKTWHFIGNLRMSIITDSTITSLSGPCLKYY